MLQPGSLGQGARRFGALAATFVLIAGCGTSSASPAAPGGSGAPNATAETGNLPDLGLKNVSTQTTQARGATIGPNGGKVTATADNGTAYSLVIPPGAIDEPTQVAVYPVSNVAGLPSGSKPAAGAQFTPDGLMLNVPATLTITMQAAPDPKIVHGLAWQGDGVDLHAYPASISGTSATIVVYHFSGTGVGNPPLVALSTCSSQSEMEQYIAEAIGAAADGDPGARDKFTRTLKACYASFVKGQLVQGALIVGPGDIEAAIAARDAYDTWFDGVFFWADAEFPGFTVTPEVSESRVLAAKFLRTWFDTTNANCVIDGASDVSRALFDASNAVGLPHLWAPKWGIDSRANRLDYETLLTDACVHVVIDPSRGFSGSKPGDSGTVTVPVGYSWNGEAVLHDEPIHVKLTKTGESASFVDGDAPSDGRYTAPYVWPANVNPLRIDVLASLVDYPVLAVFDRITKHPGSKIALAVRNGGGQIVIEVMDEDGTHLHALTSGPADLHPSWSPDGTKIAFARQVRSGGTVNQSIQVINADGSGLTALTSGPNDAAPAWAPDGSRIAFSRSNNAGKTTIFLMNPDGTNVVDTGVKLVAGKVSWSPDSKRIVYTHQAEDGSGTFQLWAWPVAGGGSTQLATPTCQPWGAILPDSSSTGTIAFFCVTHGNPNGGQWIATMSATGGDYEAVTGNLIGKAVTWLSWSPDGTKLAIVEDGGILVGDMAGGGTGTNLGTAGGTVVAIDWGP